MFDAADGYSARPTDIRRGLRIFGEADRYSTRLGDYYEMLFSPVHPAGQRSHQNYRTKYQPIPRKNHEVVRADVAQ
jgi:hypothetical protein